LIFLNCSLGFAYGILASLICRLFHKEFYSLGELP
jgi:hypothetical protein